MNIELLNKIISEFNYNFGIK